MPRDVRSVLCIAVCVAVGAWSGAAWADDGKKPAAEAETASDTPLERIGSEDESKPLTGRRAEVQKRAAEMAKATTKTAKSTTAADQSPSKDQKNDRQSAALDTDAKAKSSDTAATGDAAKDADAGDAATEKEDKALAARKKWLDDNGSGLKINKDDRAALVAFYTDASDGRPLWVDKNGLTDRGRELITVLKEADDWGLDAKDFEIPEFADGAVELKNIAKVELALTAEALRYARFARGGRLRPKSLSRIIDQEPPIKDPAEVLKTLASDKAPKAYLEGLHPQHPQFEKLRQIMLSMKAPKEDPKEEPKVDPALLVKLPSRGKVLKAGSTHEDVALLRQRLKVEAAEGEDPEKFDDDLSEALKAFQKKSSLAASGRLTRNTRKALNAEGAPKKKASKGSKTTKIKHIVMNMERWRWMPEDLGRTHVWNNIPEFYTRVMRGEEQILRERIIVGLTNWATPVFSADMKYLVFNPSWGMPPGIKARELKPRLQAAGSGFLFFGGGGASVIRAYGLKVYRGGKEINPDSVNWSTANLNNYSFIQPAGPKNPLGIVKFRFPNKHNVYMHDTIEPELFAQSHRAKSHGCIRVQNPRKFAALMIQEGNSVSSDAAFKRARRGGRITLDYHIPVHTTYFTAVVSQSGKLMTFGDLYGHDSKLSAALFGRSIRLRGTTVARDGDGGSSVATTQRKKKKKKKRYVKNKKNTKKYLPAHGLASAVGGSFQ